MSKPLTIDELKALQVGDWVWFLHNQVKPCYGTIMSKHDDTIYFNTTEGLQRVHWKNYGKTWVAYKNKEQAERQTKYKVGDTVYFVHIKGYGKTIEECAQPTIFEFTIHRIYCGKTKTTYYVKGVKMGIDETLLIGTKEEAEARLKELRGEK